MSATGRSDAGSEEVDELVRQVRHMSRPRVVRFWRVAGPLITGQVVFLGLVLGFLLLSASVQGDWGIALGVLVAPALLAYFARPVLLARFDVAKRLMAAAAGGVIVYALLIHNPKAASVPPIGYVVLGYVSFHINAVFWMFSDASIVPARRRWWHGKA